MFKLPATRTEFWNAKISANIQRDLRSRKALMEDGWRVATVWECSLRGRNRLKPVDVVEELSGWLLARTSDALELQGQADSSAFAGTVSDGE